ncbi:hypothetical protein [Streptomyces himalayensis]|uniref:Uncharacterized protein n=1 Tax=Streptomyces himalayensis subsp. himalayensis TaxID=2756131 RepID=A0A7W0DVF6_9ACTN|nr:hypothetical protein [Streptomyces himalayensis]MBA2951974.1 hypothetical protein [Streptomyces himalayensis subsp. himalayensis]
MHQPTEPPAASEEPLTEEPLLCPCGNPAHQPTRIGQTVSRGPERNLYACPETTRYGLGRAS